MSNIGASRRRPRRINPRRSSATTAVHPRGLLALHPILATPNLVWDKQMRQLRRMQVFCLARITFESSIRLLGRRSPYATLLLRGTGGPSSEVPPVPISNTEVKLTSSDGTWTQPGPGRVARCRTEKLSRNAGLLCLAKYLNLTAIPYPRNLRARSLRRMHA